MSLDIEEISIKTPDNCQLRGLFYRASAANFDAPVCVCIHGLGVDLNTWIFVAPRLQAMGISTLCIDLRGHGLSDSGKLNTLNPKQMAEDIIYVYQELKLSPTYLMSQSFGGHIALQILHLHQKTIPIKALYAIIPSWKSRPQKMYNSLISIVQTFKFLKFLGKKIGFMRPRQRQRRDHTQYAGHPDIHMSRFAAEAASISWIVYAKLLIWLRFQGFKSDLNWKKYAEYPVHIIAASNDEIWSPQEWRDIHQQTAWPLHWIDMQHTSLATEEKYSDNLMEILKNTDYFF